jgi:cytochrome c-type biogenesis protein CcmH
MPLTAQAEIIFYEFEDPALEERFNRLIGDLRCPKCQNNNLADSNAPLSVDLKDIVYEKMNNGATDKEIIEFLKLRYGDFIYYKPPINSSTFFIWFGPFIVFLLGVIFIYRSVLNSKQQKQAMVSEDNLKLVDDWDKESKA